MTKPATPDEARAILAALHALTSAPPPREDCPFALVAETKKPRRRPHPDLFEKDRTK
jgi:hypothetical protein